jgi:pyruvate dehydrogenase E1 component
MVVRTLQLLARGGDVPMDAAARAVERYRLLDVTAGTTGAAGDDS